MMLFNREYKKIGNENIVDSEKKISEKFTTKDILALIIATFQLILPFAIIVVSVYFFIILFMTKVWMK